MDDNERDQLIAKLVGEGKTLSEVQKILQDDYNIQITYMELRLISSDLEINWQQFDKKKETPEKIIDKDKLDEDSGNDLSFDNNGEGKTVVNVSKLVRPGAVMSGDVKFKSGAKAEWSLDPIGRLSLNPAGASGSPTEEDLQDFQIELQKSLQGKF